MEAEKYLLKQLKERELFNCNTDDCYQVLAEIMDDYAKCAQENTKPIITAYLIDLMKQYNTGEISLSRVVELLNQQNCNYEK